MGNNAPLASPRHQIGGASICSQSDITFFFLLDYNGAFRLTAIPANFLPHLCAHLPDILPAILMVNGQQRSTRFTASLNRRSFYLLLAGFNSTWRTWILWSDSRRFIYGKPDNGPGVNVDVSAFTRFSSD
ncbi:hypothetical protein GOODEAATRI_033795 [Goodea atripinnis]|uniref:Uncharacterized protein n=1 Tax=Goodea atripinnis TaxID=208336 RepID=A0ABV0P3H5_9TELE